MSDSAWPGRIHRALTLRVIGLALVCGVGLGVVVGLVWPAATIPAMWVFAALAYTAGVFNDGQMVRCDACGKRVKLGSSTCHHCGYGRA